MSYEAMPYLITGAYLFGVVVTHLVCLYVIVKNRPYLLESHRSISDIMYSIKHEPGDSWMFSKVAAWTWPLLPLWFLLFGIFYCVDILGPLVGPWLLKIARNHFKK